MGGKLGIAFKNNVKQPHMPSLVEAATCLGLKGEANDVLMALFFAIAAKEVWEAVILEQGSLRGKKAATPLFATAGGMFGPIAVYLGLAMVMGSETYSAVANGWAIPTATDIAFSYLVGRLVFGAGHPAVRFLLLLAIADDAAGLIILAIFKIQVVGALLTIRLLINLLRLFLYLLFLLHLFFLILQIRPSHFHCLDQLITLISSLGNPYIV